MKKKSLGVIEAWEAKIVEFDGRRNEVVIAIDGDGKRVKIKMSIGCTFSLLDLAHQLIQKQRTYAVGEWNSYKRLKAASSYAPPQGEE
jgi:hypothetical protein